MELKKVTFNEELGHLVDQEGAKYDGRRTGTITAHSTISYSSYQSAERDAIFILEGLVAKKGADAYEVIATQSEDSRQEYDSTPFRARVTAILYKPQ